MIVYEKTDESSIERQRMTTSNNKWQWGAANDWYNEWKPHSTLQTMGDCLLSVAKTDALLFDVKKNECIRKVFTKDSWSEWNNYLFHITPKIMDGRTLKNHPSLKNGWFKLIFQRKLTVKKMDGQSLLLSSNIAILYFKYEREQVVLWKKYVVFIKVWSFK